MKNIIFIAPPAAGKGTQSDLLVSKYGYTHISTGDLLRHEIDSKTDLGKEIESIIQSGGLVSDEIVTKLLLQELENLNGPFILDGYPRNIKQADILDSILNQINKKIDIVIYLNVDEKTATQRATGRLSCPKCKATYHKYNEDLKPKVDNICDKCGATLISRDDDTEETFKNRYKNYIESTQPLIDYYQNKDLLCIINKVNTPIETFQEIEKVIKND